MKIRRSKKIIVSRNRFSGNKEITVEFPLKQYNYDLVKQRMYLVMSVDQAKDISNKIYNCIKEEFPLDNQL